jgi:hypothetical protein
VTEHGDVMEVMKVREVMEAMESEVGASLLLRLS